MKFEVVEDSGAWAVCLEGQELARFDDQETALADVATRLRESAETERSYSLAVRYQSRG
jgi:hypothetical protein